MGAGLRTGEAIAWAAAVAVSGLLCWHAWRGPVPTATPTLPSALPRPATDAELAAVEQTRVLLQASAARATAVLGRPPSVAELEATLPDGSGVIDGGIPDNPLVPGVGAVFAACPPAPPVHGPAESPDWWYCPQTGAFAAALPR